MAVNNCRWELSAELCEQIAQGNALFGCACVGGIAGSVKPSDIANTYGVGIMPRAMRTGLSEGSAMLHCAVKENEKMIADVTELALQVPAAHIIHIEVPTCFRSGAMDDNLIDCSHLSPPFRRRQWLAWKKHAPRV